MVISCNNDQIDGEGLIVQCRREKKATQGSTAPFPLRPCPKKKWGQEKEGRKRKRERRKQSTAQQNKCPDAWAAREEGTYVGIVVDIRIGRVER